MTEQEANKICDKIRQTAYDLHVYLGVEYVADMVVDGIIIELKSVSTLLQIHLAQLLNYMKAMKLEHGLLINFGSEKFQCKKVAKSL